MHAQNSRGSTDLQFGMPCWAVAGVPVLNDDFVSAAADDLRYAAAAVSKGNGISNFDLSAYKRSFGEALAQLRPADQAKVSKALGGDLATVMTSSLENAGFSQSELLAPLIVVIHLAGLDQSFAEGFKQVSFHRVGQPLQCANCIHIHTAAGLQKKVANNISNTKFNQTTCSCPNVDADFET